MWYTPSQLKFGYKDERISVEKRSDPYTVVLSSDGSKQCPGYS